MDLTIARPAQRWLVDAFMNTFTLVHNGWPLQTYAFQHKNSFQYYHSHNNRRALWQY